LNFSELKSELHRQCLAIVNQRIDTIQKAIADAQATANSDTKSSAGDKYETTRSMMQLEIEQYSTQLAEAMKLKEALVKINPELPTKVVQPGSLVLTNNGDFYLATSVGSITVNNKSYVVLSPASPVGALMTGLKTGNEFVFNKRTFVLKDVV
jgi:transcription elongation GreA/GreB family factor